MHINAKTGTPLTPCHPPHPLSFLTHTSLPALSTPKILLVPYGAHHVPTYHTWMQLPALQAATASEPLTLHEEYAMQKSWRTDRDKLTFIVCRPLEESTETVDYVKAGLHDEVDAMIGDVNLFISPEEDSDEADGAAERRLVGEIELMIALPSTQHQGYGCAALVTFMQYVLAQWTQIAQEFSGSGSALSLAYLRVRIQESNVRSIKLFESIGFERTAEGANYFGEIELRWRGDVEDLRTVKGFEEVKTLEYRTIT